MPKYHHNNCNQTLNRGIYIITQIFAILFFPIISLILSVIRYKDPISLIFFTIFAFRYGYIVDCHNDLEVHYLSLLRLNNLGFINSLSDPEILSLGIEPYHFVLKYLISQISLDSKVFAGICASIYSLFFCILFRQYYCTYKERIKFVQILVLCGIIFTVEWQWYFGIRFWSGAFCFLIFYTKYILHKKIKFLFFSFSCLLFHFALLPLPLIGIISFILKEKINILHIIALCSIIIRTYSINLYVILSKLPIINTSIKSEYLSESNGEHSQQFTIEYREVGNIFYQNRIHILFLSLAFCFFLLWKKNTNFYKPYNQMYAFILILIILSNLGYSNFTFYDRFSKLTVLLMFCLLALLLVQEKNKWLTEKRFIIYLMLPSIIYAILTTTVMLRARLLNLDLWFANIVTFFIE